VVRLLPTASPVLSTVCSCINNAPPVSTITSTTTKTSTLYYATVTITQPAITKISTVASDALVTATTILTTTATTTETYSTIAFSGLSRCTDAAAAQPTCALPTGLTAGDYINPGYVNPAHPGVKPMRLMPGTVSTDPIHSIRDAVGLEDCVLKCSDDGWATFATFFCGLQTRNCFCYTYLDCGKMVEGQVGAVGAGMLEYGIGGCRVPATG